MSLLTVIVVFVVVGVILWLVNAYVPMDPRVKTALSVVVVVLLLVWVLTGILGAGAFPDIRIGN